MNIVIEGPDGSGKSTLARALSEWTGRPVYKSRGRCKEGLLNRWYSDYNGRDGYIFDRHPCVSEFIYVRHMEGMVVADNDSLEAARLFYTSRPLIIYCDAPGLDHHSADNSSTDDIEYLARLSIANPAITRDYRVWAGQGASLIYNFHLRPDDLSRVVFLVSRYLNYEGELTHV